MKKSELKKGLKKIVEKDEVKVLVNLTALWIVLVAKKIIKPEEIPDYLKAAKTTIVERWMDNPNAEKQIENYKAMNFLEDIIVKKK